MATPHNRANPGDIEKTVLMPGDPLRAKYIAENFLDDIRLVNDVRGMLAYTGSYKGKPVSVMGSGMGIPSIGIYSWELFKFYGVENIIRVGSCVSFAEEIGLMDVIIGTGAYSDSSFARMQSGSEDKLIAPSKALQQKLVQSAARQGIKAVEGVIHSSDVFYYAEETDYYKELHAKHGCICGEMESFGLYHNARVLGKNAATLLTVSDSVHFTEEVTAEDRQTGFAAMIEIALGVI